MSHFGRSGPPDIRDTYSLLVLNISFRTTVDDLYELFDRYGKVVDVHIPRDRRTGESRGFAFVRYKYAEEAQKAVDRLAGRNVDGREIMVQFAKYGPNAEPIRKGRIVEALRSSRSRSPRSSRKGRIVEVVRSSRSRSPRSRSHDDYHRDRYHRGRSRSQSRSRSRERYGYGRDHERERDRYGRRRSRSRSISRSLSPDYDRRRGKIRYDDGRSRSRSIDSASPVRRRRDHNSPTDRSPASASASPRG